MFVHVVLFEIASREVKKYREDSKMWARCAKKAPGFIAYFTLKRQGYKNQYASVYEWKEFQYHQRFMAKFHDRLVDESTAKVKVLGYYNLNEIDKVR